MSKVHSYKIGDGMVTFAMMKKQDAENYYEILKQKESVVEEDMTMDSYALGRVVNKETLHVTISVIRYNNATGKAQVVEQVDTIKMKSNQEMRRLMTKYNLLD